MYYNNSLNLTNFSYFTPTETIKDYCIEGVNNLQTITIITLNIVIFAILYILISRLYYKKRTLTLQLLKLGALVMTALNAILMYYWIAT